MRSCSTRRKARQTRGAASDGAAELAKARRPPKLPSRGEKTGRRIQGQTGDTLSRIASELKPSGVSLDMMLVALYRANPTPSRART